MPLIVRFRPFRPWMPVPPEIPASGYKGKAGLKWLTSREVEKFAASGTDAFRLADSPGLWVERFGSAVLISMSTETDPLPLVAGMHARAHRPEAVFCRRLVHAPGKSDTPWPVLPAGSPPSTRFLCRESGLAYEVDFSLGYSCGFFPDQRANRSRLSSLAAKRVLNCFAFTCSFSVSAAFAGASTTSIDLSKSVLARGRQNFEVNNLPLAGHRFYPDDVFECLPRLARRGERFDAIILDPPTFSRGRGGKVFRAENQLGELVGLALACAEPGAEILLSTNCSGLDPKALRQIAALRCPGAHSFHEEPALPDIPAERAARTLWFRCPG